MTSRSPEECERLCQQQRLSFAKYLAIADSATVRERRLCQRVMEAAGQGGAEYDKALAHPAVNLLFNRGALYFRQPEPGAPAAPVSPPEPPNPTEQPSLFI